MARSRNRRSPKKEVYYIVCILTVMTILAFSLLGPGGYQDLRKARLELQEQHIHVDRLEHENQERMKSIEKLRSDKHALERYAREKNYGREGEIIQRLPKDPKSPK
jgi:cell division protein FtsB